MVGELFNEISKSESVEWMEGFAKPLPMQLIVEIIGFPTDDAERVTQWSRDTLAMTTLIHTHESLATHVKSVAALTTYLAKLITTTKADPGKNILGALALATRGVSEALTDREAVSVILQLLSAGQETTSSLLASAVMMLAKDPALQDELRHDISLIPAFIEEVARLESPFQGHYRVTTQDTEINGIPIAQGTRIMLLWGSANRDEDIYTDADLVDLWRTNLDSHLAFGVGPHHCVGAPIVRLEAQVALEGLLDRSLNVSLANAEQKLPYLHSTFLRSLTSLPLHIDWR
jgi:cytochrome P450